MTDLNTMLARSVEDQSISRAESQAIVKEAGGSHQKLVKAIQATGIDKGEADRLANAIEVQAKSSSASGAAEVSFPTPAPLKATDAGNFATSAQARINLLRSASQVNAHSAKYGNGVCGGAAVMSALILDSKSVEAAQANAKAIRATLANLGMSAGDYEAALASMESGTMSADQLQQLQVLMYEMAQALSGDGEAGITAAELGGLVAMLRAQGGLQHSEHIRFNLTEVQDVQDSSAEGLTAHWTVDVDGAHANTWSNDKYNRSAIVESASAPHTASAGKWVGEVKLHDKCDFVAMHHKDQTNNDADVRLTLPFDKADGTRSETWGTIKKQLDDAWKAHQKAK